MCCNKYHSFCLILYPLAKKKGSIGNLKSMIKVLRRFVNIQGSYRAQCDVECDRQRDAITAERDTIWMRTIRSSSWTTEDPPAVLQPALSRRQGGCLNPAEDKSQVERTHQHSTVCMSSCVYITPWVESIKFIDLWSSLYRVPTFFFS